MTLETLNTHAASVSVAPFSRMPKPLEIVLPDYFELDTVAKAPIPFVLWHVGDQCLLAHWLDYAVNRGHKEIIFYCSDRPAMVRKYLEDNTLWPIRWELRAIANAALERGDCRADHLPEHPVPSQLPETGWSLIDYWMELEWQWLEEIAQAPSSQQVNLCIGHGCRIHPSAELIAPFWIGDHVYIGPGATIGPYALIGDGVMIEGPSVVAHSVVESNTYLSGYTEVDHCWLEGSRLINFKHRAVIRQVDAIMAGNVRRPSGMKVGWAQRLLGGVLFLLFGCLRIFSLRRYPVYEWTTHQGIMLRDIIGGPLGCRRLGWLWAVCCGRMRLIGVLPRSKMEFEALDAQWQDILQDAPCGVVSYADLQGVHRIDDPMEALHAVYQATQPSQSMSSMIALAFIRLMFKDIRETTA